MTNHAVGPTSASSVSSAGLANRSDDNNRLGVSVAAVRAYVLEMADAGASPGMNGYQRIAGSRGWPSAKAVVDRMGSWPQALLAVGFDAPRSAGEPFVTQQHCIAAVAAYAAEATQRSAYPGQAGYQRDARSRRWPSLTTVKSRLGPWTDALVAAGVSLTAERRPDRQACLSAVSSYVVEMQAVVRYPRLRGYAEITGDRGWPAVKVVTEQLGSWSSALSQAGFAGPTRSGGRYVALEECVVAVGAYVVEATAAGRHPGVVGYDAVSKDRGWPQRQSTVNARLGSWSGALSAAGYSDPIHQRNQRVSRARCLDVVRSYLAEMADAGGSPSLAGYGKLAGARGWPAVATVLARLGSWREAVEQAHSTDVTSVPDVLVT